MSEIDAIDLQYTRVGQGTDALLLHGLVSSRRMWAGLSAALADTHTCWAVDLAGFGDTMLPPRRRLSLDDHVRLLLAFCERHALQPRVIVGHSMGGMLALMLAHALGDTVERLVLVCPVVTGRIALDAHRLITTAAGQTALRCSYPAWALLWERLRLPRLMGPPYLNIKARARICEDLQRASWGATVSALESIAHSTTEPLLAGLQPETLVIVGGRDPLVPPAEGRLAVAAMPNARLLEFARSHHQPMDEEPERFNAAVRAFVLEGHLSHVDRNTVHGKMEL